MYCILYTVVCTNTSPSSLETRFLLLLSDRKCVLLTTVAFCSTVISFWIYALGINIDWTWRVFALQMDFSVNTVCLFMQFSCAKTLYVQCCKYPDSGCRWCISFRMKRWTKRNQDKAHHLSIGSRSPSATSASAASTSPKSIELSCDKVTV